MDAPETLRQGLYGRSVRVRLREKAPGLIPLVRELPFVTEVVETAEGLRVALNEPKSHNPELIQALSQRAAIQFVEENHIH